VGRGGAVLVLRQQAIDPAWAGTRFQVTAKKTEVLAKPLAARRSDVNPSACAVETAVA
jgi:hypothetical protein